MIFIGVEQKQIFKNVKSYLDDKVKQNVENVPIDELDTIKKIKAMDKRRIMVRGDVRQRLNIAFFGIKKGSGRVHFLSFEKKIQTMNDRDKYNRSKNKVM